MEEAESLNRRGLSSGDTRSEVLIGLFSTVSSSNISKSWSSSSKVVDVQLADFSCDGYAVGSPNKLRFSSRLSVVCVVVCHELVDAMDTLTTESSNEGRGDMILALPLLSEPSSGLIQHSFVNVGLMVDEILHVLSLSDSRIRPT